MALAAAGCAPVTEISPQELHLDTAPTQGPVVKNVKVENGAGTTLWSGAPGQTVTANPPLDLLDGKVTITRTYDDGTAKRQTLTYEAHRPIKIGYSSAGDDYYIDTMPPPAMPKYYLGLNPSYTFFNRPDTPIIRRESGGVVTGFVNGDNDTSNPAFNGKIGVNLNTSFLGLTNKWGLELNGSYYTSTGKTDIDSIPADGGQLAFFGPLAGGGAVTGNDITNLRYKTDYWSWSVGPRIRTSYDLGTAFGTRMTLNSYLGFDYGEDEDDEDLDFDIPAIPLSTASRVQLDSRYYGPDFGFYTGWEICDRLHLTTGAFAKLYVNDLEARRTIDLTNGLSGADSTSKTEFTAGGGFNVGLNYKLAPNIVGKFGYEYERSSNTPFLNVDQQTGEATVGAKGADIHRIQLGAQIKFQ